MTVQDVIDAVSTDVRQVLSNTGADAATITTWIQRVEYSLLYFTKWDFLLSDTKTFLTKQGVTGYWVGPVGTNPAGTADTGLNLNNLKWVKHGTVYDRSNFKTLGSIAEPPVSAVLSYTDGSFRPGRPALYRSNVDTPNILNIYPAPDQQNDRSPQPEPPIVSSTAGGALPARVYFITATFVDALGGESTAPAFMTELYVPANSLAVVQAPVPMVSANDAGVPYNQYNIYASSTSNLPQDAVLQTASPLSTGVNWTEPNTGLLTVGDGPPSTNGAIPLNGYVIQFRYYLQEDVLTSTSQVLLLPDRYKEVLVAGVNWYALQFIGRQQEAMVWIQRFMEGRVGMIRDRNQQNRFADYISPDPSSIGGTLPTIETIDLSLLTP